MRGTGTLRSVLQVAILIALIGSQAPLSPVRAVDHETEPSPMVTVVFSSSDQQMSAQQRKLNMLLSHFTTSITFQNAHTLQSNDLSHTTHLFYFGEKKEALPSSVIDAFKQFTGFKMVFGHNYEQLPGFQFVRSGKKVNIDTLSLPSKEGDLLLDEEQELVDVQASTFQHAWIEGRHQDQTFPILIENDSRFYYADDFLSTQDVILLGEVLHEILKIPHHHAHPATLSLEDVHPLLDASLLEECANLLFERNIYFIVSVTPVYKNPITGERYRLEEAQELVEVLQDLQKRGATITLHGYTDQASDGVTGEGFEFGKSSQEGMSAGQRETYTNERLQNGIKALQKQGLEPVAFETPHYAIFQDEYKDVADYFSLYIGQLQLTDENWKAMDDSPFLSEPTFIHGMTFVPETLRYIEDDYAFAQSLAQIRKKAHHLSFARDSVMSVMYHPYLGPDGLKTLIEEMERIPDLEWLDVKQLSTYQPLSLVEKDHLEEETSVLDSPLNFYFFTHRQWIGVCVGLSIGGILFFISYFFNWKWRQDDE